MKRLKFVIVWLCLCAVQWLPAYAGGEGQVLPIGREVLSLDKGWLFHQGDIPMPEIKGHGASYRNAKAGNASGAAAKNYDDSSWRMLDLPHDWAIEGKVSPDANLSQGYYKRGIGWYRRHFRLSPEDKGKHIEIQFEGIATYATIWVNGTVLHRNWCGYTSMYIDITPYVTYGNDLNTIAVRVDADSQEGWWYEGAGIYRHTWLVKRSPLHIVTDGVWANPVNAGGDRWTLPVEVSLYNIAEREAKGEVEVSLQGPDGKTVATKRAKVNVASLREGVARLSFDVNAPGLWSPESPTLYNVRTTVIQNGKIVDQTDTRCGFRTVRFDANTGFWLNGKNIKIKGTCNHQDHAGVGVAVPDALMKFRLRKLKEMGVNAYRAAHHPVSKEFMALCDSMGMMVMDENRVFNTSPEYVRQLEWLVRRDRNCPSVILWSVFNEEPMQGTENGYEMVRRMKEVVKRLDETRPVTAAMNGGSFSPRNVSQAVDVVGFNYQIRDYDRFHKANPELPMTSSEDGSAIMTRGEYVTDKGKHILDSYDTQCVNWGATHRNAWKAIAQRPWMAGCFYWTGFDYHGEPTPHAWPTVSSFFGIMDLCGFPKSAYWLHQAQWRKDIEVLKLIPHWNWPESQKGKPVKVMALSNAERVKLLLNGKEISEQAVDSFEMNTWMVPYEPGKLEAIGYRNGKEVSRACVETTGKASKVRLTPDRSVMNGDGYDAIPVTVEVLDKKGRPVPTANNMMEFSIEGPARIIGLGNGDPNCHEPEKGNKRSLFNGLAQVIIQSTGEAGEIRLSAKTEGLEPHTVVITARPAKAVPSVEVEFAPLLLNQWLKSPFYHERPDMAEKIADNDMNTWEPFSGRNMVSSEEPGYVIFQTTFEPHKSHREKGGTILLKRLVGKAEVWLNGKKLQEKSRVAGSDFRVDFPPVKGKCELRVLFIVSPDKEVGLKGNASVL